MIINDKMHSSHEKNEKCQTVQDPEMMEGGTVQGAKVPAEVQRESNG